ncbi:MAG TPA: mycothiol synthase [Dehalococcoidia bacterium]|nr:mycothiol synthase [Dehalococcoidia bacterium]
MHHIEVVTQLGPAHLEQLPPLIAAAAHADGHEPLGEHKFLRLQRGDDLSAAVLAYDRGRLVGYAHATAWGEGDARRAACEFVVDPAFRRLGVGRKLLDHAIAFARSHGARRFDVWAYNDTGSGRRVAEEFGFVPSRRLLHLHRHMRAIPQLPPPPGASLRAFRPGDDDDRWLELNARIFAAHPEQGQWTREDLHTRMRQPWFDARDFLLLEVDGTLAGFCWLKVEERANEGRVGEIYVIGAAPEYQGRGLGAYLLSAALQHLRGRGADVAAIYVDESNRRAVALYERLGFHYHHVDVCYSLDLRGAARAPRAAEAAA